MIEKINLWYFLFLFSLERTLCQRPDLAPPVELQEIRNGLQVQEISLTSLPENVVPIDRDDEQVPSRIGCKGVARMMVCLSPHTDGKGFLPYEIIHDTGKVFYKTSMIATFFGGLMSFGLGGICCFIGNTPSAILFCCAGGGLEASSCGSSVCMSYHGTLKYRLEREKEKQKEKQTSQ